MIETMAMSPDGEARVFLQRCTAPPSLHRLSMDLNPDGEYKACYVDQVWRYIGDSSFHDSIHISTTTLTVTGALFETDEVLDFLQSGDDRVVTLELIELDVYMRPTSCKSLDALSKFAHSLEIHFKFSPHETIFTEDD